MSSPTSQKKCQGADVDLSVLVPYLRARVIQKALSQAPSKHKYSIIYKYGIHVQNLQLYQIDVHGAPYAIRNRSNLRQLELVALISVEFRNGQGGFPEPMFRHVSLLRNLRSLQWAAKGMTIHVDDILCVLKVCPRLVSLHLGVFNVMYVGHDTIPTGCKRNVLPGPT